MIFYILAILYASGFAFFIPALFNTVARREPIHHQGKIFGLVESSDTVAIILGFLSLRLTRNWNKEYIFLLSFLLIGITFFLFHKIGKNHMNNITSTSE